MARTDNSTTTRRAILAEAVLTAWRAWRALEEEDRRLQSAIGWKRQAQPKWAQNPSIEVVNRVCYWPDMIDDACNSAPAWMKPFVDELRNSAKKEFADIDARAAAHNESIGIAPLERRAYEIEALQDSLIETIEKAEGSAPVIIAAKLDLALSRMDSGEALADSPLCYIAAAVRGLLHELPSDMRTALAPIAAGEGTIDAAYRRAAVAGAHA
jgi:hypothetical protein